MGVSVQRDRDPAGLRLTIPLEDASHVRRNCYGLLECVGGREQSEHAVAVSAGRGCG